MQIRLPPRITPPDACLSEYLFLYCPPSGFPRKKNGQDDALFTYHSNRVYPQGNADTNVKAIAPVTGKLSTDRQGEPISRPSRWAN